MLANEVVDRRIIPSAIFSLSKYNYSLSFSLN
jgi:hypothetical protein